MRSFLTLVSCFLSFSSSSLAAVPDAWDDYKWSLVHDLTADEYRENGIPTPKVADAVTTVEKGRSYVVKVDCPGCPFIIRELGMTGEELQAPPLAPENALLLNFTIDTISATLFLDNKPISPLAPLPNLISAYQSLANVSADDVQQMIKYEMFDESWGLGTKYGTFDLSYEHTRLATKDPLDELLQFDIVAICTQGDNPVCVATGAPGQQIVQILLHHTFDKETETQGLEIRSVDVVDRNDKTKPLKMPCGKDASITITFRTYEWDIYGQFGTWTRTTNYVLRNVWYGIEDNAPWLVILTVVLSVYFVVMTMKRRRAQEAQIQDAEALFLYSEDSEDDYLEEVHSPVGIEVTCFETNEKEVLLVKQN